MLFAVPVTTHRDKGSSFVSLTTYRDNRVMVGKSNCWVHRSHKGSMNSTFTQSFYGWRHIAKKIFRSKAV